MKKRTAVIGALVSLLPIGQPLGIGTGVVLASAGVMLSVPEKVNAERADFYFYRSEDKSESGDYYGAIADLSKVIEINPKDSDAYNNRGYFRRLIGDYYGAIADALRAIELRPNFALAYANLGTAKDLLGDVEGACADWMSAFNMGDQSTIDWFSDKGRSYCKKNNY